MDAFSSSQDDLNLYKLDVEAGKLELLLKKTHSPTYIDNNNNFLLIDNNGQVKIVDIEGNIIKELPIIKVDRYRKIKEESDDLLYCDDLEYKDGNIIGINMEKIFIYNVKAEEITNIQNKEHLNLIGVGKSKIYLSNN